MKTMIIREYGYSNPEGFFELDMRSRAPKDCTGCWSCWLKTPGRCIFKDLDEFYRKYLEAERVLIYAEVKKGFLSGSLKSLLDRMIPLYLPYVEVAEDGCNHEPRYDRYPNIEFHYRGKFHTEKGRQVFEDFVRRTFTQFRSERITIKEDVQDENTCN